MFNLFSIFFYFFSLLFNLLKNSVTNPLLNVKNAVINDVISLTDTPIADINDAVVIFLLVTWRTTKFLSKHPRTFTHLSIYLLIFSLPGNSPIKKYCISLAHLSLNSKL